MTITRDEYRILEKEVKDLKELVEALKAENYRLAQPTGIETIPSPPPFPARVSKKRATRKRKEEEPPTESGIVFSGDESVPTDSEALVIEIPADPEYEGESA